ncbi:MAG TPA: hypothetical protein VM261_03275 [Kofleriaceae bacterium]|nr:hypothetical protein [Kofleriaceae bacterium]
MGRRMVRVVFVLALVGMVLGSTGCFAIALGSIKSEEQSAIVVDTRSGGQADVAGTLCYVERKNRKVMKREALRGKTQPIRAVAGLEVLLGGLMALAPGSAGDKGMYGGLAFAADGALALLVMFIVDDSVVTRERWEATTETGSCM